MYDMFVIHFSIDGHLGWFYNLAIVDIVAIKLMCKYFCDLVLFTSFRGIPRIVYLDQIAYTCIYTYVCMYTHTHIGDTFIAISIMIGKVYIPIRGPFISVYFSAFVICFLSQWMSLWLRQDVILR